VGSAKSIGAHDKVDTMIARYPGPVSLPVSRVKWLGLLGASLAFLAGSIYMSHGWFILAFFGICAIVGAVMLLPGAGGLTLRDDGFETVTLYKKFRTPWQRVSDFAVSEVTVARRRRKKFVGYNDTKYATENFSRRMSGYNSGMADTYGLSHEELARLMNGWRALALMRRY
jgi:hypothetical protein